MATGALIVRSGPPEVAEVSPYHRRHDVTRHPELPRSRSARRFADDVSFTIVDELDDVEVARTSMAGARATGSLSASVDVQPGPPPVVNRLISWADGG